MTQQAPQTLAQCAVLPPASSPGIDKLLTLLQKVDTRASALKPVLSPYYWDNEPRQYDKQRWYGVLERLHKAGNLEEFLKAAIRHLGAERIKSSNTIWLVYQFATLPVEQVDLTATAPDIEGALIRWETVEKAPGSASAPVPAAGSRSTDRAERYLYGYFNNLLVDGSNLDQLIHLLTQLRKWTGSVVRIIGQAPGNPTTLGSGFRIGPKLILSNYHVLCHRDDTPPLNWSLEQRLADGPAGLSLRVGRQAAWLGDKTNDWAVLEVDGLPPPSDMPVIRIDQAVLPEYEGGANIIQYPGNDTLKVGFMRNFVREVDQQSCTFRYLTDTDSGSSGSPIFDNAARLIGMHASGGNPIERLNQGVELGNAGIVLARVIPQMRERGLTFADDGAMLDSHAATGK